MTTTRRLLLAAMATALVPAVGTADVPKFFPFFEPVKPPRPLQVMAHRGMASSAPENTRRAIAMCADDFFEWVEVDVRLSKDGKHVLFHDDALDGKTDGRGPLKDRTADELLALDAGGWFAKRFAGERMLTLAEGLKLAKGRVNLYLDCKRIDPTLLATEIVAAGMETQVIVYDKPDTIAKVREASKGTIPVMTKWRPASGDPKRFAADHHLAAVEIDADDLTPDVGKAFHDAGVKVQAKVLGEKWDKPAVWAKAADAGADWLQTDRPLEVLTHAFRRRSPAWPVKVSCHRGANRYAPENTLPALELAAQLGADYIEFDIRTTRDGRFFLLHDRTLDRTTTGKGPIADVPADVVEKLDAGSWFGKPFAGAKLPTLDDALTALGESSHAYLDAKAIAPEKLAGVMKARGFVDRSVVYQSADYLKRLRAVEPAARGLPPYKKPEDLDAAVAVKAYGVDAAWGSLSKEMVERCHAAGVKVFSDALGLHETVADYRRAIGWKVDVIQTDYPARVLRAVELHAAGVE
jgi:glycerophosphoryl diester phosphodiesterase